MNNRLNAKERAHLASVCCHDGCGKPVLARGFCQNHYMQRRRAGDSVVAPRRYESDADYIARKIAINENGCWEWTAAIRLGYGQLMRGGKHWPAHAFSYATHVGPIPDGMQINHKCHNRRCVNPDHLYAGTQKENMRDMKESGRANYLRGEKDGNSKITEATARAIYESSGIARHIAERHGVSISLVYAIQKKQIWKHIHE